MFLGGRSSDTMKRTRSGLPLQALHATTGRHETNVSYRNLYGGLSELRSKSGNWPRSCGAPVWGVALRLPCFSESTRPFACSLNVLTAVMWQTRLFCFHGALLLSMSVMESFDPALTPLDAVKGSTATCNFPCISQSLSWANWWFDIWYVENVKWGLFSPSAINPFSAQVWNGIHVSVRCCKVPLTLCTTSAVRVLHWFTWLVWLCFTTLVTCEWACILLWEYNVMLRRTVEVFRDRMHWCVCAVDLRLRCCLLVERPEILALVLYKQGHMQNDAAVLRINKQVSLFCKILLNHSYSYSWFYQDTHIFDILNFTVYSQILPDPIALFP